MGLRERWRETGTERVAVKAATPLMRILRSSMARRVLFGAMLLQECLNGDVDWTSVEDWHCLGRLGAFRRIFGCWNHSLRFPMHIDGWMMCAVEKCARRLRC